MSVIKRSVISGNAAGEVDDQYRGQWNASTNLTDQGVTLPNPPTAPSYQVGDWWQVSTAGTQFSLTFTVGDELYVVASGAALAWAKRDGGIGDVVGPASATDNAIARYDATTGKLIQNSGVIIDDSNNISGMAAINEAAYVTVASATTCDIGAAASNNVAISGTTTITSFGTAAAGITRRCRATGAFLITYNSTSLITKNGKNITTKPDDCFTMTSLGSGNWIMTQLDPADGRVLANAVNNQTGTTYTLALTDLGNDVTLSNAAAITLTIPTAATFPIGTAITVRNIGVGTVSSVKAAGSTDTIIGNTTLITGAVAIFKVLSASSWGIFAGTAVVNMPAVNSVTMSLATSRTEYLWFVQANCTLLGITSRCSALTTAGTFKLQLSTGGGAAADITGLTGIVPSFTATTTTFASAAVNLVAGDVVTIVADGTLNAVTNMTISPIFTVTY